MTNSAGFVDIHSHVLYGLDDGAKTREDSLKMLAMAERSDTTDIVATPHANGQDGSITAWDAINSQDEFRSDFVKQPIRFINGSCREN